MKKEIDLIKHLENCFTHKDRWRDRDCYASLKGIATAIMLIKTGHKYELRMDYESTSKIISIDELFDLSHELRTVIICFHNVITFEDEEEKNHYFPVPKLIDMLNGKDWY